MFADDDRDGRGVVRGRFFFSSRRRHTRYWRDWSSDVCSSDLMLIFSFIMVFILGAKLVWIFFVVIPVLAMGLILIIRKAFPFFQKIFIQYDSMNNLVQENIKSMRVIKSYVREEYEEKKRSEEHTSELQSRQYLVCRL